MPRSVSTRKAKQQEQRAVSAALESYPNGEPRKRPEHYVPEDAPC